MSAAQLLLRRLLDQAGGATETGFLLVIESEGLEDLPPEMTTPQGVYGVHQVATELGLRHLLWKAKGAPLIAVMPEELAGRLQKAPDLLRRSRNQRVHALSVNDVLEVVLGVRVVGAEARYLQELAMEHLDKLGRALSRRTLPTVVDRKLLTEILVDETVGQEVRTRAPAELLADWVREPPQWKGNVSRLVRESLPTLHFDEGKLLAWALEEPETRLQELAVHGALLSVEDEELPKKVWGPLWRAASAGPAKMDRRILRRTASRLAEDTLSELGDTAAGALLTAADRIGRETLTPAQLRQSRVLPLAFEGRCHDLAHRAAEGQAIDADEIAWLAKHRAARLYAADLAVLESMARLSRYLNRPWATEADVLDQVRGYQRQGAFSDLAALELRRSLAGSVHYHAQAQAVLEKHRERRDRDNRRFAETLAADYEPALHSEGLTPLNRVWKRTVNPLWQAEPEARLYLVVLDGCSYPVFLDLLFALAQDTAFPVGIRPDKDGHVVGLPALSPLPTVTSHSRGALFLGELPSDPLVSETVFRNQDEAKTDKARFRQNDALGGRSRKLFLKGDLTDGGLALSRELKSEEISIVAAVFNAVDDQIESSNTGVTVRIDPESIKAFKPSLRVALEAGRRVLVTADHGYSPFVDNSLRAGAGSRRRFVTLEPHEEPPEGFLEIDLKGLGGPPERRAFAWRCGTYLGHPKVGFHGGCGLEEMVVPLAWLERDGLYADEPAWWYGSRRLPEPTAPARPAAPPIKTPLPSDEPQPEPPSQMSLFDPAEKAHTLPLPADLLAELPGDQKAALVLLRENGAARASELAHRLEKNPGRLNGLMRTLRRTLHAGGFVLFTDEVLPSGETLYRYQPPESL